MNFGSEDQLTAVAQSCRDFESNTRGYIGSVMSSAAEQISCSVCDHWDGAKCQIDVFDKVLTSLDQT